MARLKFDLNGQSGVDRIIPQQNSDLLTLQRTHLFFPPCKHLPLPNHPAASLLTVRENFSIPFPSPSKAHQHKKWNFSLCHLQQEQTNNICWMGIFSLWISCCSVKNQPDFPDISMTLSHVEFNVSWGFDAARLIVWKLIESCLCFYLGSFKRL